MLSYKQILDNSGLLIIEKDKDGNILKPRDKESLDKYQELILNIRKIDGSYCDRKNNRWYDINVVDVFDDEDQELHTVTYIMDVTYHKNKELNAQIDKVTNLYNRALTDQLIHTYILDAKNKQESFSIVFGDLDGFKNINDTYGHLCGDKILREISNVLVENTINYADERDVVGRFGGDEFCLLFKNVDKNVAIEKAEFLKRKVENLSIVYEGESILAPTMSMGVYHVSFNELEVISDIDEFRKNIYEKADKALYYSKNIGKNRVTDYDNLDYDQINNKNRI